MPAPQFPELDEEIERLARESVPSGRDGLEYGDWDWIAGFIAGYKARRAEIEWLRSVLRQAIEAYDSGTLQLSSPEVGEPENDIPMHFWHDEWLHYARSATEPQGG